MPIFQLTDSDWNHLSLYDSTGLLNGQFPAFGDLDGDSLPDILLVGNYYENNIQMGRYDADYGTILLNKGHDSLSAVPLNGVAVKGQTRHIQEIAIAGRKAYILARNDDSVVVIRFADTQRPGRQPSRTTHSLH